MLQRFAINGLSLVYMDLVPETEGKAEAVVLIHGFASTHAVNWVNTRWTTTLLNAGYRVIAMDNRGHGQSDKPHEPAAYDSAVMAEDVRALIDHLAIKRLHVMGYSMGARIAAHLTLAYPERVQTLLLGGLGIHLVDGVGLPPGIADAMEAEALDDLIDPTQRMFRAFADQNGQDRLALAACIRGSRQTMPVTDVAKINTPTLISVGTNDPIAGAPEPLAELMPNARAFAIQGRDHNLAVGDRSHKEAVLAFLAAHPLKASS
ncbi:MAG: alpha/beta fold hydrolase [Bosea sp. (in: a-proteobacteria)]